MSTFDIVKLSVAEWQAYRALRLESLRLEPQAFGSSYQDNVNRPDSFWQDRLASASEGKKDWLLFARQDGRLLGMIGAYQEAEDNAARIISVYVSPASRGMGIGAALMAAILAEVRRCGRFRKAILTVNGEQQAAVRLYRRFGFRVVSETTGRAGDGLDHPEIHMEVELERSLERKP